VVNINQQIRYEDENKDELNDCFVVVCYLYWQMLLSCMDFPFLLFYLHTISWMARSELFIHIEIGDIFGSLFHLKFLLLSSVRLICALFVLH